MNKMYGLFMVLLMYSCSTTPFPSLSKLMYIGSGLTNAGIAACSLWVGKERGELVFYGIFAGICAVNAYTSVKCIHYLNTNKNLIQELGKLRKTSTLLSIK